MSTSAQGLASRASGAAVIADDLYKSFGETKALAGVSFEVQRGTVLGLLGPNGAGKTTAVRVLTTLVRPDSGRAFIDGIDVLAEPTKAKARIGLTGQYAAVDERLTGAREPRARRSPVPPARSARRRSVGASCSSASISSTPPIASSRATPAACGVDSTSP